MFTPNAGSDRRAPYRLASQRFQGEIANPAHGVVTPVETNPAVVQRLAAYRLAHLFVCDVGNLLAVNPDLDALSANLDAELVAILAVDLDSLPIGQLALAVLGDIAIAHGNLTIGIVERDKLPSAVAVGGKRVHVGAALVPVFLGIDDMKIHSPIVVIRA